MPDDQKVIELPIYWKYYVLIAGGKKTVEVRVNNKWIKDVKVGDVLRFKSRNQRCDMEVTRRADYPSIETLMSTEDPVKINPNRTREQQIYDIRGIYTPDKERLGMVALEMKPSV